MQVKLVLGNVNVVKLKKPADQKINLPSLIIDKADKITYIYYYEKRKNNRTED
jgi:hypothetical protein